MYSIDELQEMIEQAIEKQSFFKAPAELYEPLDYTLQQKGKRLRPVLVIMACDIFDGPIQEAILPAIGIEVFHNFTLIHDDIMDQSPMRRGKETVYKKWDNNIAILSGDAMFIKAYEFMLTHNSERTIEILKIFNQTAIEVCEGQQFDMNFEKQDNVCIDDYINMIRLKTAVLLGASLKIGAIIGHADARNADLMYQFGEQIGLAFQLKDDLLDTFGDPSVFGKQTGTDILSNKKTYLYLKAFEIANESQKKELINAFNISNPTKKIQTVISLYDQLDVKAHTEEIMKVYYNQALKHLEAIQLSDQKKQQLTTLAEKLMVRIS